MSEEAQTALFPHSHDSMYLVTHCGGKDYPLYESCHHCSYINVPLIKELVEALEYAKDCLALSVPEGTDKDPMVMKYESLIVKAKDLLGK